MRRLPALLVLIGLAFPAAAQPDSDAAFQKELQEGRKALEISQKEQERLRKEAKAAAGDFRREDLGTFRQGHSFSLNVGKGPTWQTAVVTFLYEEGPVFDTLKFARVT